MAKKKKKKIDIGRDRTLAQLGMESWNNRGQDLGTAGDRILK